MSIKSIQSKFPGIKKIFNKFGGDNSSLITTYKIIDFLLKSWANEAEILLGASTNNSGQNINQIRSDRLSRLSNA
jgi:hypothetical protein